MCHRPRPLRVGNPKLFLRLPLLRSSSHRHARSLRTSALDYARNFTSESRLSPRTANPPRILTLEPVRSAAGRSHASVKLAWSSGAERLGCLWLQLLGVEAFSFLPNAQGNGSDLARQRQARHRRLHAFGQQTFIELTEGAVDNA